MIAGKQHFLKSSLKRRRTCSVEPRVLSTNTGSNKKSHGTIRQCFCSGGLDSLAGATVRRRGEELARQCFFIKDHLCIKDHLDSTALVLEAKDVVHTVLPGGPPWGHEYTYIEIKGETAEELIHTTVGTIYFIATPNNTLLVYQDNVGIIMDDGSTEIDIDLYVSTPLEVVIDGSGTISLQTNGGGTLISDASGMLIIDARLANFPALIISSTGAIYGSEFASEIVNGPIVTTGLRAVEQIEYSPYGEPTVHARGFEERGQVEGEAILNVHDDTLRRGLSPTAKSIDYRNDYLSLADSDSAAVTTQESYSNNASTSSVGLKFLFTGRAWHPAEEIYYYRARWYDPQMGRFLTRDPIGYEGGAGQYQYCMGNPVNFVDPTGQVIELRAHLIPLGGDKGHLSLLITPDAPTPDDCKGFGIGSPFSVSAGPEPGWNVLTGSLVGEVDRSTDKAQPPHDSGAGGGGGAPPAEDQNQTIGFVQPPEGMTETEYIDLMLTALYEYNKNPKGYFLFPHMLNMGQRYNSNSFVTGIVKATGGTIEVIGGRLPTRDPGGDEWWYPGADRPIPPGAFR